jgi:hypothetical protein
VSGGVQGPKGPRAALWRGLGDPDLLIVACALVVAAFSLVGLQWIVTSGHFTAVAEARFLRTPKDDWGHVSWQVGALKRRPPARTAVYLLGGSNVRECIQTAADLERAIKQRSGVSTEVHDLGSTEQHFGESMAIVDNLPRTPGVVLIGVNQTRFQYSPPAVAEQLQGRELLLRSPALRDALLEQAGLGRWRISILPGVMNYAAGWVDKNRQTLERGRLPFNPYVEHRYHQAGIWSESLKRSKVELWTSTKGRPGGDFDSNVTFNEALLEAMVKLARDRGFTPVLLEVPENAEIVGTSFDSYKAVYQPFCRDLAARYGGAYLDFGDDIGLVNTDFRDLTHLVESGRVKWTAGLSEALAPIVRQIDAGEAGR